ncbi:MAG TPA: ribonuclease Y [Candidatus Nanopelagicales bacterium]|nr:ribonuclease Y [Candidatus Nanopelagicales bacterium]
MLGVIVVLVVLLVAAVVALVALVARRPGELPAGTDPSVDVELERARAEFRSLRAAAESEVEEVRVRSEQQRAALEADVRRLRDRQAQVEADLQLQRAQAQRRTEEAERREARLHEREDRLDTELGRVAQREEALIGREAGLAERQGRLDRREAELAEAEQERSAELERIAGLTADQARAEVVAAVEARAKRDAALTVREIEREAVEEGEARARNIVTLAAQRVASEQTAESTVSVLALPDDSMKGRIIGREGRNIRTFEAVTGVNVVIDDTPEAVLLSSFDPVRREVARLTLQALVADGRIQPSRIEDVYEKSRLEVDARCIRAGEDAWHELGLGEVHPDLLALMGRLRYRTSYGQNVLGHLVECAHLAGVMAAELRLPIEHAKRCAVLHDVGKALTHEVEGSHAIIGAEVARRYGENDDVVHAIEAHHNEVEVRTLEAVLTQTADAMSGGRPGARRESLEHYVERLERLEAIAQAYDGVDRVFAMQAGREVRVVVLPEAVDDIGAQVLARDIAQQIETELTYPGQIRVTVVRESRATGLAR